MVEYERFAQVEKLREMGWKEDEECQRLGWADETIGGGTFMIGPDERYYQVGCGTERPLDGIYDRWCVQMPTDSREMLRLKEENPFVTRSVVYANGKVIGHQ